MRHFLPLPTYVWNGRCVRRIEISGRKKHRPLNTYISLSQKDGPLANTEDTVQLNPEEIVIGRESADNLKKRICKVLSPFENQVLKFYLQGMDYRKIAEAGKNRTSWWTMR